MKSMIGCILARYYNKRHNRRGYGYFWGDCFKSVIVDKGETLVNCLAYIDLNPLRAGIVSRPEDYRWFKVTKEKLTADPRRHTRTREGKR